MNYLYQGDNLIVLRKCIETESVDLCYIDPPFQSAKNYKASNGSFIDTWEWDDHAIWGIDEILTNYHGLFTQQCIALISGLTNVLGKGSLLAYLVSMTLRITEIHRVLKPTGSFYLHCDPTASHYLKLILDAVFCSQGGDFLNEIIWSYKTGGISKYWFGKKHDIILFYVKTNKRQYIFNPQKEKAYIPTLKGRTFAKEKLNAQTDEEGCETCGQKGGFFHLASMRDVWNIQPLFRNNRERLGYPTQKPEALLERIIQASSNENDVILDAYCGCGTTVAVCQKLDRQWIGIDINPEAINLTCKRLIDGYTLITEAVIQ